MKFISAKKDDTTTFGDLKYGDVFLYNQIINSIWGNMMARLDDYDYDAQFIKNHPLKVGFHLGFKSMALMIDRLVMMKVEQFVCL